MQTVVNFTVRKINNCYYFSFLLIPERTFQGKGMLTKWSNLSFNIFSPLSLARILSKSFYYQLIKTNNGTLSPGFFSLNSRGQNIYTMEVLVLRIHTSFCVRSHKSMPLKFFSLYLPHDILGLGHECHKNF
jgi:hypothetical protein